MTVTGGKFKLTKGYRAMIETAREEAAAIGLSVEYTLIGRHPKLHISDGIAEITLPFASTPRSKNQEGYARSKIRFAARALAAKAMNASGQDQNAVSAVGETDLP